MTATATMAAALEEMPGEIHENVEKYLNLRARRSLQQTHPRLGRENLTYRTNLRGATAAADAVNAFCAAVAAGDPNLRGFATAAFDCLVARCREPSDLAGDADANVDEPPDTHLRMGIKTLDQLRTDAFSVPPYVGDALEIPFVDEMIDVMLPTLRIPK